MGTSDTRRIPWRRVLGRRWLRHGGVAVLIALVAVLTITSPAEAARPRLLVDQTTGLDATQPTTMDVTGIGLGSSHAIEVRQCAGARCRILGTATADAAGQFTLSVTVSYQFIDTTGNLATCASVYMIFACSISMNYLGGAGIDTVGMSFAAVYQPSVSFSNTVNLPVGVQNSVTVTGVGALANTTVQFELCRISSGSRLCQPLGSVIAGADTTFVKVVQVRYEDVTCDITASQTCSLRVFHGSPSGGTEYNTMTIAARPVLFTGHYTGPATTAFTSSSAGSPTGLTFAGVQHGAGQVYSGYQCVAYFGQDHCQLMGAATVGADGTFSIVSTMLYSLADGTLCHTDAPTVVCRAELRYDSGPNTGQVHSTYPIVLPSPMSGSRAPTARVHVVTVATADNADPSSIVADASRSTDGDGSPIASYTFYWGDGAVTGPQAGPVASHAFTDLLQRSVTVIVKDSLGQASSPGATAAVPNVSATATIGPLLGNGSRVLGLPVTVGNQATSQVNYLRVLWGDGSVDLVNTTAGTAGFSHIFASMPSGVVFEILVEAESSVTGLLSTYRMYVGVDIVTGAESGINYALSSVADATGSTYGDSTTGFVYSMTSTPAYIEVSGSAAGVYSGGATVTHVCMAETWTASTAGSAPVAPAANFLNLDTTTFKKMSASLSPVVYGTGQVQSQLTESCSAGQSISLNAGGLTNALRVTANSGPNPGTTMRCLSHWQRFRAYNGTTLVRELEARGSYCRA